MTREGKLFVMSAGVALTSAGLLVVGELGFGDSESGRWIAVSLIVLVLAALAAVLWRRP